MGLNRASCSTYDATARCVGVLGDRSPALRRPSKEEKVGIFPLKRSKDGPETSKRIVAPGGTYKSLMHHPV